MEDIESGLATGNYQLWESDSAAMVTAGVQMQGGGIGVQVLAAGGDYGELMRFLDDVEEEARAAGCVALITTGRRGWRKTAKARQWKEVAVTLVKSLT